MRLVTLLAVLIVTAAWGSTPLEIASAPLPNARGPKSLLPARLYLPSGTGPFPALVVLHTCAGLGSVQSTRPGLIDQWTDRLTGWGYAALVPDSLTPRGATTVCGPENRRKTTPLDRTGDAVGAALALRVRPEIDGQRIAVIGFSHGGATAAQVALAPAATAYPGLIRAAISYYGGCGEADRYKGMPLLALAGEDDDWGNPVSTCRRFAARIGADQPFELVAYPGVVHSFDNINLSRSTSSFGHRMQYDHAAAEDSFARVRAFLARYVE